MRNVSMVAALGFGQIAAFASSFYLLGVLGDPISRSLELPPTLPFNLLSGAFLLSAVLGPLAGRWLDARGGREVLLASNLVFAGGLALIASASSAHVLGCGMLVIGVGMAIGLYGSPYALLVQVHGDGARPWITTVALLGGLGSSLGWLLTSWFETTLGWRGAAAAWAGLHLGVCLPLVALLTPSHLRRRVGPPEVVYNPPVVVQWDRRMIQLAVLFAGAWFVSTCISAHLPRLLVNLGLSPGKAILGASLLGVAAVAARSVELLLLRRLPPVQTARLATLLHPAGVGSVLTFGGAAALPFVVTQGLANGMLAVANGTLPLSLFGRHAYGYRSAILNTPAKFVQAAGPALFALALAHSAQLALLMTGAVCVLMFLMTFNLTADGEVSARLR